MSSRKGNLDYTLPDRSRKITGPLNGYARLAAAIPAHPRSQSAALISRQRSRPRADMNREYTLKKTSSPAITALVIDIC